VTRKTQHRGSPLRYDQSYRATIAAIQAEQQANGAMACSEKPEHMSVQTVMFHSITQLQDRNSTLWNVITVSCPSLFFSQKTVLTVAFKLAA
jgi:hypothetical protein